MAHIRKENRLAVVAVDEPVQPVQDLDDLWVRLLAIESTDTARM